VETGNNVTKSLTEVEVLAKAERRRFTAEYKLKVLREANHCKRPGEIGALLRPEDEEQWLDASRTPFAKAKSLLMPYPEELMEAHDVSTIVNSANYDGPECFSPLQMMRHHAPGSCPCCKQH
jgi:hypothetical protein